MTSRFDRDETPNDLRDATFMAAAINYGRRGLGVTAPNPAVGCVIVKDGVIISLVSHSPVGVLTLKRKRCAKRVRLRVEPRFMSASNLAAILV